MPVAGGEASVAMMASKATDDWMRWQKNGSAVGSHHWGSPAALQAFRSSFFHWA
jgi:hypothetical protein